MSEPIDIPAKERRKLLTEKSDLLRALEKAQVASVVIEYDGEGDNGQIQAVHLYNRRDKLIPSRLTTSLRNMLHTFAWEVLDQYHGGFEDNDGGCGDITINVPKRTIVLDHNDRFTDFVNTLTEV